VQSSGRRSHGIGAVDPLRSPITSRAVVFAPTPGEPYETSIEVHVQ
jgi:hypothetical protein